MHNNKYWTKTTGLIPSAYNNFRSYLSGALKEFYQPVGGASIEVYVNGDVLSATIKSGYTDVSFQYEGETKDGSRFIGKNYWVNEVGVIGGDDSWRFDNNQ